MYGSHYGSFRAGGISGRLPAGYSEAPESTVEKRQIIRKINALINDEKEAIKKYQDLLNDLQNFPTSQNTKDLFIHILEQEKQHLALLKRSFCQKRQ